MWVCGCGCKNIAADLAVCPMCAKEREMPKATIGGASNAWEAQEPGAVEPEAPVAAAEVPADAEVSPAEPVAEPVAAVPVDVSAMSKAELQDHADSLGLPISGSKSDLAARIVEHHESVAADAPPEPAAAEPEA